MCVCTCACKCRGLSYNCLYFCILNLSQGMVFLGILFKIVSRRKGLLIVSMSFPSSPPILFRSKREAPHSPTVCTLGPKAGIIYIVGALEMQESPENIPAVCVRNHSTAPRVQLECYYGIRSHKPYHMWSLSPNSIIALSLDPLGVEPWVLLESGHLHTP